MLTPNESARVLAAYAVARALGDVPGHEFHGNQYTAGSASHMAAAKDWKGWANNLTPADKRVLDKYQSGEFTRSDDLRGSINERLRQGELPNDAERLTMALSGATAPRDLVLYRGVSGDQRVTDSSYMDKGFASTSLNFEHAASVYADKELYDKPQVLEMHVPKGTRGVAYLDAQNGGKWSGGEGEVLLDKRMEWHRTAEREENGHHVVVLHLRRLKTLGDLPGHEFHGNQWTGSAGVQSLLTTTDKDLRPYLLRSIASNPDRNIIEARGKLYSTKGLVVVKGEPHECHTNTAKLLAAKKIDAIVTGYALHKSGVGRATWHDHTWGLKDGKIVETTVRFDRYFGAKLTGKEAVAFGRGQGVKIRTAASSTEMSEWESVPKLQWQQFLEPRELASARTRETSVHAAADAHYQQVKVAVDYAFAMGRRAVDGAALRAALRPGQHADAARKATERAAGAVREALLEVLPKTLGKVVAAGGKAGAGLLVQQLNAKRMRVAGDVVGHEFHGNQWTGFSSARLDHEVSSGRVGDTGRVLITGYKKPEERTWLDSEHEPVTSFTLDLNYADMTAYANRIDAKGHAGYGRETLKASLDYAKARGFKSVSTYIEHTNDASQSMVGKLGFTKGKEGPSREGVYYHRVLAPRTLASFVQSILRTLKPQKPGQPHTSAPPFALQFNADDPRAAKWAREHVSKIADDISETSKERINNAIGRVFESDEDREDAYDLILEEVGDEARADMIARTEIMTAANEGQREAWDQAVDKGLLAGDEQREWITTDDDLLCPACAELDGARTTLDGEYPDDGGEGPPLHPNSIIAGVLVEGNTIAATRMSYAGQVREFVTASGRRLTVTKNHAVATCRGFLPAGSVEESDYLLTYNEGVEVECEDAGSVVRPVFALPEDVQYGPTEIEQVFSTLVPVGKLVTSERLGTEFHGDAAYGNGDIDIVYADVELGNRVESAILSQRNCFGLKPSDRSSAGFSTSLLFNDSLIAAERTLVPSLRPLVEPALGSRIGAVAQLNPTLLESDTETPACETAVVGESQQGLAVLIAKDERVDYAVGDRKSAQFHTLKVGATTKLDATLLEMRGQFRARDTSFIRELEERLPRQVSRDQIIEIRDRDYFGHVYDLSTVSGVIVAESLIISNCRCTEGIVG